MLRLSSSWSHTLRKLSFKGASKARRKTARRFTIEPLEERLAFSTSIGPTQYPVGNCSDGCPCECSNAQASSSDSAVTSFQVAGVNFTYNSDTQTNPVFTFNALFDSEEDAYVKLHAVESLDVDDRLDFEDTFYAAPESSGYSAFSVQANDSNLESGRHYWLVEYGTYDESTHNVIGEEHHFLAFQDFVNRDESEFGAGWQLTELDHLVVNQHVNVDEQGYDFYFSGVSLITGNNHAVWYEQGDDEGDYTVLVQREKEFSLRSVSELNGAWLFSAC